MLATKNRLIFIPKGSISCNNSTLYLVFVITMTWLTHNDLEIKPKHHLGFSIFNNYCTTHEYFNAFLVFHSIVLIQFRIFCFLYNCIYVYL